MNARGVRRFDALDIKGIGHDLPYIFSEAVDFSRRDVTTSASRRRSDAFESKDQAIGRADRDDHMIKIIIKMILIFIRLIK